MHSKLEETEAGYAWKEPRSRSTFGEGSRPSEPEILPKLTDPVEIEKRWEELMSADPEHLGRDNANALQNIYERKSIITQYYAEGVDKYKYLIYIRIYIYIQLYTYLHIHIYMYVFINILYLYTYLLYVYCI